MSSFAVIVRIFWPSDKEEVHLIDSEKFVIGRSSESTLILADPKISRKHLGVLVNRGKIYLKDLGAGNGTYMDDKRLSPEEVHPYKDGKSVRLGSSDLFIKMELMPKRFNKKESISTDFPAQDREAVENLLASAKIHYENAERSAERLGQQIIDQKKTEAQAQYDKALQEIEALTNLKTVEANTLTDSAKEEGHKIVAAAQESAKRKVEEAELHVRQTLERAHADVLQAKTHAQQFLDDAKKKIDDAKGEAEKLISHAKEVEKKTLETAEHSAKQYLEKAQTESQMVHAQSREILAVANQKAEAAVHESLEAAKAVAKQKADQLIGDAQNEIQAMKLKLAEEKKHAFESQQAELTSLKNKLEQEFQIQKEKWAVEKQVRDQVLEDEFKNKKIAYATEVTTLEMQAQKDRDRAAELQAKRKDMEVLIPNLQGQIRDYETSISQKKFQISEFEKQFLHVKHEKERAEKQVDELQSRMAENARLILEKQKDLAALQQDIRKSQDDKIDVLRKINQELQNAREQVHHEAAKYRKEVLSEIDGLKAKEKNSLHQEIQQGLTLFTAHQDRFIKQLSTEIEGLWLTTDKKASAGAGNLQIRVREAVQKAFDESYVELSRSADRDVTVEVKEISKQREVAVRWFAIAAVAVIGIYFGASSIFGWDPLRALTHAKGNESAIEAMSREEMEKQAAARKFTPIQDSTWKVTYTDNIIYTEGFLEAQRNPELEEQWIRLLNQVFVKELKMDEEVVARLVGVERSMITRLEEEKKTIHPDFVDISVNKMKAIENESFDKIKEILTTDSNMARFKSETQKYWEPHLQTRIPATDQSSAPTE